VGGGGPKFQSEDWKWTKDFHIFNSHVGFPI